MRSAAGSIGKLIFQRFESDGAVKIDKLLNASQLDVLRRGIERNSKMPSSRSIDASVKDDPGYFFEDFVNWPRIPEYRQVMRTSSVAEVAANLMSSNRVRMFHDHLLIKEPGTISLTPWHQDIPFYNVEGFQNISFWIPVDEVAQISCPKFIKGSHLGPTFIPRSFRDSSAKWFPEGDLPEFAEADLAEQDILSWDLRAGDAIAFHMNSMHMAGGTPADGPRRRAWSVRLLGDDMRHAPRSWKTSPDFPGLQDELPAGSEFKHEMFPVVWPRDELEI